MTAHVEDQQGPAMEADRPVLQVRGLSVTFQTEHRQVCAVDAVDLAVAPGEVVALVGESGSGKSTAAMALLGLLPANATTTGSVVLAGREISKLDERDLSDVRGNDISIVFQEPMTSLNPVLTVGQQVVEIIRRHRKVSARTARERAEQLFRDVGIPEPRARLRAYPHELSGGMRQRVMIAIAIACDPDVIVADEPTTALDVTVQATILRLLKDLGTRFGTAVVLITHDLGVVADVADRVSVMYAGRVVEHGSVHEVFAQPRHPYTRALLAASPRLGEEQERLSEIPGVVPTLTAPDSASCTFADRCEVSIDRCRTQRPELVAVQTGHGVSCFNPFSDGGRQ